MALGSDDRREVHEEGTEIRSPQERFIDAAKSLALLVGVAELQESGSFWGSQLLSPNVLDAIKLGRTAGGADTELVLEILPVIEQGVFRLPDRLATMAETALEHVAARVWAVTDPNAGL